VRLSRHCYDKPHRCPGWAGGGWTWAKVRRCDAGRIDIDHTSHWTRNWRFHRCDTCGVVCWPIVLQQLDPTYWLHWHFYRLHSWAEEHVLWPLQKAIVLGLYTRPLRFGVLALKLDQRWRTNVWETEGETE
jgi:hypothetical protein